ncbi:MAG: hypothetical protein KDB80_05110, partial [Planctomycetes bacterium]|nr:hypothetical protein [Planctomycetota bacterium]
MLLSLASTSNSILGIEVLVDLTRVIATVPNVTSVGGHVHFPLPIPARTNLVGLDLYCQVIVADP